jgi:hypothetical protein
MTIGESGCKRKIRRETVHLTNKMPYN